MKRRKLILGLIIAGIVIVLCWVFRPRTREIILTGVVTTDDVIVSSEIQGRVQELRVKEGDVVRSGQLLALIQPREWEADLAYYASSEQQSAQQVTQARADLEYEEAQTSNQIRQAQANLAAAEALVTQAQADQENARLNFRRLEGLYRQGVESAQANDQARTTYEGAQARVESLRKQTEAAQAAVALARSNTDQVRSRRAALEATRHRLAAAGAQKDKAKVQLDYTEIHAPIDGVVDVRAALPGEVVNPGQGIVTLINPDDLWVRADVEETYIDRIRLGDRLSVRLPSGARREGTVFYRSVDADYATQRDVSRTKRDIKTFEIRLRCDNSDRALAVGMTAYVTMPLGTQRRAF
jgi:HlyD family secretion protein